MALPLAPIVPVAVLPLTARLTAPAVRVPAPAPLAMPPVPLEVRLMMPELAVTDPVSEMPTVVPVVSATVSPELAFTAPVLIGLSVMLPVVELSVRPLVASVPLPVVIVSEVNWLEMLPEPLVIRLMVPAPLVPVASRLPARRMAPLLAVVESAMLCAELFAFTPKLTTVIELALLNEYAPVTSNEMVIGPVPLF